MHPKIIAIMSECFKEAGIVPGARLPASVTAMEESAEGLISVSIIHADGLDWINFQETHWDGKPPYAEGQRGVLHIDECLECRVIVWAFRFGDEAEKPWSHVPCSTCRGGKGGAW